mgnify:CR=1 FL=1
MSFSEWREVELEEVIELVIDYRGKTPKKLGGDWSQVGYRVLSAKNIKTGRIVQEDAIRYLDSNLYTKWMKEKVNRGDILMTSEAPFGELLHWDSDEKIVLSQRLFCLRTNKKVDSKYLYYYMTTNRFQKELDARATGTTVRGLRQPQLLKCKIEYPPIKDQEAIANILSSMDEKIRVNNQINKTLENMAQAIFKQWFVDFEFPNEEGEPYKSSGGEMFESELGMIPKGWEVKKSSDIANVNIGKTPPRKEKECFTLDPDDYKWISIKDLGNSGAYIFDSSEYLTKESIEKYNVKVVPDNTVVLSFKLTIGRVSITCGQMTTNEAIAHFNLSNKSKITTEYLYLYLKGFDYGKLGNTSSIANAVNSKIIKSMPIIVPDNKTIKTFSEVMESVFSKIKYTIKQSDKLIEIRDSLLPKLMSGEIRVPLDEEGIVS